MQVCEELVEACERLKYSKPTEIQVESLPYSLKGKDIIALAETGSGKTLVGEYQIYHSLKKNKKVFYTTPIKSLSNQKFHDLKTMFNNNTVGIMTGDIKFDI